MMPSASSLEGAALRAATFFFAALNVAQQGTSLKILTCFLLCGEY